MSKLICPFCGEKIEHIEDGWCNCKNRCTGSGSIELWFQFLRTKKQLKIANAELEYIKEQIEKNGAFDNTRKALEQSEICCTEWEKQALDYKAENIALSGELERTRKVLDVAVDALDAGRTLARIAGFEMLATGMDEAVNKITALEQKDVK